MRYSFHWIYLLIMVKQERGRGGGEGDSQTEKRRRKNYFVSSPISRNPPFCRMAKEEQEFQEVLR